MNLDRIFQALREIIRGELAQVSYLGVWEYSVESARVGSDGVCTFDGRPTSSDVPLPDAVGWPLRPSISGTQVLPATGTRVLVAFVNGDPKRPIHIAGDETKPVTVRIDATTEVAFGEPATRGVARANDTVTVLLPPASFVGTIGGSPASGMVIWAAQTMGTITTFSLKVKSE